jgi:hypothetical protein
MNNGTMRQSNRRRILCAFFIGSLLTGLIFAWCVTRPALQSFWFRTEEIWTFPTRKLWLLTIALFFLNLSGPYIIAHLKGWLSFSAFRLIIAGALVGLIPVLFCLSEPLPNLWQILLFRFTLALVVSLALLIITHRWYWGLAALMLFGSLATPIIAGLPYALFKPIRFDWFEVAKFFVNSSLLAVLFGYWLVKSSTKLTSKQET